MSDQKTYTIGVIISSFITRAVDGLLEKLTATFQEKGHHILFMNSLGNLDAEIQAIQALSDKVDGIILFSKASDYAQLKDILPADKPVIFMINNPKDCEKTSITENDYSAVYQGIINLSAKGAKKIAFVAENSFSSGSQTKEQAYRAALDATGLPVSDKSVFYVDSLNDFVSTELFSSIIASGHDALFVASTALTFALSDILVVYNHSKTTTSPVQLLGYGVTDVNVATAFGIDMITHSSSQYADLAYQQMIYQLSHPEAASGKELQLKGALQMHKYNWLNTND